MKQLEKFFSIETEHDKKHKINTCNKKVPQEYLTSIEKGCSIEQLEEMMQKKFDVFKYKTQITIHGIFPKLSKNRIGEYVNIFQNKNKSIGVRYTAIDHEKKQKLFVALARVTNWEIVENSTDFYIRKIQVLPTSKTEVDTLIEKYEEEAKQIDKSLFAGSVSCYIAETLFYKYIILECNILYFYEKNFSELFKNLSGMTLEEGHKKYEEIKRKREEKEKEDEVRWAKAREERKRKEAEEQKKKEEMINKFISENPAPAGYSKREKYQPQAGDNLCRLYYHRFEKKYLWVEMTCKKYFGKIKEKPIDKDFEKYWCDPVFTDWVYVK